MAKNETPPYTHAQTHTHTDFHGDSPLT